MQLLNRKIPSLVLGAFLFQTGFIPIASATAGSCREAVENLENTNKATKFQLKLPLSLKEISAIQKDLSFGNKPPTRENLEEIWREILFNPKLSAEQLSDTVADMMRVIRYNSSESLEVMENLINQDKEFIPKDGIFDFLGPVKFVSSLYVWKHGNRQARNQQARRLPLIEAIDLRNVKLVAILKGVGVDIYVSSPYNSEILSLIEGSEFLKNPNSFRIKYPLPLALVNFSSQIFNSEKTEQIVELLLELSDPHFRYSHEVLDSKYGLTKITNKDSELIYGVQDGASDLLLVARYGTAEMMRYLIERGHDTTAKDKKGWGVENYADFNNRQEREKILALLDEYKESYKNINSIYVGPAKKARQLPLITAIKKRDPASVYQFLRLGASVYAPSPLDAFTVNMMNNRKIDRKNPDNAMIFKIRYPIPLALSYFSASQYPRDREKAEKIVEILLDESDPKARYTHFVMDEQLRAVMHDIERENGQIMDIPRGASDLMLVAEYGTVKRIQDLIERGHDVTAKDAKGQSVEDYARRNTNSRNREEILNLLKLYKDMIKPDNINKIYRGPDQKATLLPLIAAIDQSHLELVDYFLQFGADLSQPSPYNSIALEAMGNFSSPSSGKNTVTLPVRERATNEEPVESLAIKSLILLDRVVGSLARTSSFEIKYPIPLALEIFASAKAFREKDQAKRVLFRLLKRSNPSFRYNHDLPEKQFAEFIIKTEGQGSYGEYMFGIPKEREQEIAEFLKDVGGRKDFMFGVSDGASDLMLVARYGTVEMLTFLIEAGHDISAKDKAGRGVEDYAEMNPDKDNKQNILEWLKEYKAEARTLSKIRGRIGL